MPRPACTPSEAVHFRYAAETQPTRDPTVTLRQAPDTAVTVTRVPGSSTVWTFPVEDADERRFRLDVVVQVPPVRESCRLDIHPVWEPTMTFRHLPWLAVAMTLTPVPTEVTTFDVAEAADRNGIAFFVFMVTADVVGAGEAGWDGAVSCRPETQPVRDPTVT